MRYAYNETGGLINGVILYFEKGDEEITSETLRVIEASGQRPTSIVRDSPEFVVGIRLTTDEDRLLKEVLDFFREEYPALTPMAEEIDAKVFGIPN